MSSPDVASQSTGATPTTPPAEKPLSVDISTKSKAVDKGIASTMVKDATDIFANILKDKVTSTTALRGVDNSPPVTRTRTDFDPKTKTISREPIAEKGIIGDVAGAVGGAAKAGVKGAGGALAGGAAGLTGSKQNIDWKSMDKGFFRETSTTEANPDRSAKRPSYLNIGDHGFLQTSDDEDGDEHLKKSTDIFKRVLEAERPDETWTGTDKEREVPMEKIIGALLAPVAGAVGAGLGAAGSLAGGIAGGAAKKIVGG